MHTILLSLLLVSLLSVPVQARTFFSRPTGMQHCLANSYVRKMIAQARDRQIEEWDTLARLVEAWQLPEDEWDHARKVIQAIYSDRRVTPNTVANDYMTWCKKALGTPLGVPDLLIPPWAFRQ